MNKKTKVILASLLTAALAATAYAGIIAYWNLENTGTIRAWGVIKTYEDQESTILLETISWGDIYRGNSYTEEFYLKSEGENNPAVLWNSTDSLPTGVTIIMERYDGGYVEWSQNSLIQPGSLYTIGTTVAQVRLTVDVSLDAAPDTPLSFTVSFYGSDQVT